MTARVADLAGLPDWPRLLSDDQAAAYLGVSSGVFRSLGIPSLRLRGRVLYDRHRLDTWVDSHDKTGEAGGIDDLLSRYDACQSSG